MVSFRPTAAQAFGRGAFIGVLTGLAFAATTGVLWVGAAGHLPMLEWSWVPVSAGLVSGAAMGLALGRGDGADIDDTGVQAASGGPFVPWRRVADVRTERRRGRTWLAICLDDGQIVRLAAPYDGRWLGGDAAFERKLFMLRHLWETHRNFAVRSFLAPNRSTSLG